MSVQGYAEQPCPSCGKVARTQDISSTTIGTVFVPEGHKHDPNVHTAFFRCDECGQDWFYKWKRPCPNCDYNTDLAPLTMKIVPEGPGARGKP